MVSSTIGRLTLRLWVYRYDRLWHAVLWYESFQWTWPVSYTHLDVYKRQCSSWIKIIYTLDQQDNFEGQMYKYIFHKK